MKKITYEQFLTRQKKNKKSKSKYKNKKVWIDGYVFDSRFEGNRYIRLKHLENRDAIDCLELQPRFLLSETLRVLKNGKKETYRKTSYVADFAYYKNGLYIVEDTKGVETETYKLKRKLFLSLGLCDLFREVYTNKVNEYKVVNGLKEK